MSTVLDVYNERKQAQAQADEAAQTVKEDVAKMAADQVAASNAVAAADDAEGQLTALVDHFGSASLPGPSGEVVVLEVSGGRLREFAAPPAASLNATVTKNADGTYTVTDVAPETPPTPAPVTPEPTPTPTPPPDQPPAPSVSTVDTNPPTPPADPTPVTPAPPDVAPAPVTDPGTAPVSPTGELITPGTADGPPPTPEQPEAPSSTENAP